jgi:threonine/homoserine efflux transporter RhtA
MENFWRNFSLTMATILQLLKSRTIVFAILLAILPLFAQYIGVFNLTPMQQMIALQVIAAIVAILRVITTQPISEK